MASLASPFHLLSARSAQHNAPTGIGGYQINDARYDLTHFLDRMPADVNIHAFRSTSLMGPIAEIQRVSIGYGIESYVVFRDISAVLGSKHRLFIHLDIIWRFNVVRSPWLVHATGISKI